MADQQPTAAEKFAGFLENFKTDKRVISSAEEAVELITSGQFERGKDVIEFDLRGKSGFERDQIIFGVRSVFTALRETHEKDIMAVVGSGKVQKEEVLESFRAFCDDAIVIGGGGASGGMHASMERARFNIGSVTPTVNGFENLSPKLDMIVISDDDMQRMRLYLDEPDYVLGGPGGGVGTLQELFQAFLDGDKTVFISEFFEPLFAQMEHMYRAGFSTVDPEEFFAVVRSQDDIEPHFLRDSTTRQQPIARDLQLIARDMMSLLQSYGVTDVFIPGIHPKREPYDIVESMKDKDDIVIVPGDNYAMKYLIDYLVEHRLSKYNFKGEEGQVDFREKNVVLVNEGGYYNPLIQLLYQLEKEGYMSKGEHIDDMITIAHSKQEAAEIVASNQGKLGPGVRKSWSSIHDRSALEKTKEDIVSSPVLSEEHIIVVASSNDAKVAEIKAMFAPLGMTVLGIKDTEIAPLIGNKSLEYVDPNTHEGRAEAKAERVRDILRDAPETMLSQESKKRMVVVSEDSSVTVEGLYDSIIRMRSNEPGINQRELEDGLNGLFQDFLGSQEIPDILDMLTGKEAIIKAERVNGRPYPGVKTNDILSAIRTYIEDGMGKANNASAEQIEYAFQRRVFEFFSGLLEERNAAYSQRTDQEYQGPDIRLTSVMAFAPLTSDKIHTFAGTQLGFMAQEPTYQGSEALENAMLHPGERTSITPTDFIDVSGIRETDSFVIPLGDKRTIAQMNPTERQAHDVRSQSFTAMMEAMAGPELKGKLPQFAMGSSIV